MNLVNIFTEYVNIYLGDTGVNSSNENSNMPGRINRFNFLRHFFTTCVVNMAVAVARKCSVIKFCCQGLSQQQATCC